MSDTTILAGHRIVVMADGRGDAEHGCTDCRWRAGDWFTQGSQAAQLSRYDLPDSWCEAHTDEIPALFAAEGSEGNLYIDVSGWSEAERAALAKVGPAMLTARADEETAAGTRATEYHASAELLEDRGWHHSYAATQLERTRYINEHHLGW